LLFNKEFIKEIIENQMWVLSSHVDDYRTRVATNNMDGIKFKTYDDIQKYFRGKFTKPKYPPLPPLPLGAYRKPSPFTRNIKEPRIRFGPQTVRRNRKGRKARKTRKN
jgi:hypothetical protein